MVAGYMQQLSLVCSNSNCCVAYMLSGRPKVPTAKQRSTAGAAGRGAFMEEDDGDQNEEADASTGVEASQKKQRQRQYRSRE